MPFFIALAVLTLGLSPLLVPLGRYALQNDLFSHILLMPAVCGYLVWQMRAQLPGPSSPLRALAIVPAALGLAVLALRFTVEPLAPQDAMAANAFVYVAFVWAAALFFLGRETVKATVFPLALLLVMVPFPIAVEAAIETVLQHGSAECAYWMFRLSGMTLYRDGLVFHLPGISMEVAPQCSGIRSSLVLFITSLVGGYLFLRSPWRRTALAVFVLPLALMRNGFRVFVLGELSVHIGPHMLKSPIHHQGGPIFFALSLIPFMGMVWLLMRGEARAQKKE
jgi:exosortase C (VPDSG-CTERM-specific)